MKKHYSWWGYIKHIIRAYPSQYCRKKELKGVELLEFNAVDDALDAVLKRADGPAIADVIKLVHFAGTHTIDGAAYEINCSRSTAMRAQRHFFETVARNRGLLD